MRHFIHSTPWKYHLALLLSWDCGASDETQETHGFTHLAEHLLFFGTDHYTEAQYQDILYRLFSSIEARTSQTQMKIYCLFHRDDIQEVCEFLSNMLNYAHLAQDDFPKIHNEIQQEIQQYQQSQEYHDLKDIHSFIPYTHSPLGYKNLSLTYETCLEAQDFLRKQLQDSHLSVFLLGNWTEKEISHLSSVTNQYLEKPLLEKKQKKNPYWIVQNTRLWIQARGTYDSLEDDVFFTWLRDRCDQYDARWYILYRQNIRYWVIIGDKRTDIWDIPSFEKEIAFWRAIYKKDLASDIDVIQWHKTIDRMQYYHEHVMDASANLKDIYA